MELNQIRKAIQRYRIGALRDELAELQEMLSAEIDVTHFTEAVSFAAKTKAKSQTKSRTCKKGYSCGASCINKNKNCRKVLPGQAGTYAAWLKLQQGKTQGATGGGGTTPQPQTAPATPPPTKPKSKVTTNQQELDKKRKDLIDDFGQKAVTEAEKNVQQIMESEETSVWVRVGNTEGLETRLNGEFKNSAHLAEMGIEAENNIPGLKDDRYQDARERVEEKVLGIPSDAKPDDRPIYGYYGGNDLNKSSHQDVAEAYGSIAVKLKPETKNRATFTGADSFKSGIASEAVNPDGDAPPPPNAASFVASTRHGYDVENLDSSYPDYYKDKRWRKKHLEKAANAQDIDDLNDLTPSGNRYVEAQIFGGVKPDDIAEIHFEPKEGAKDAPNAAIAQLCKDKGIDIYVNGKKVDPDDYINPPKNNAKRLERALDTYDAEEIVAAVEEVEKESQNFDRPGDGVLGTIYAQRGYDGKPTITDADTVTKAWQDGGTLMARGMNAGAKSRTQFHDELKNGDYFVGKGMYGNGTYVSAAAGTSKEDGQQALETIRKLEYSNSDGVTARMALPKDANIATQTKLRQEQNKTREALDNWPDEQAKKSRAAAGYNDLDDQIRQVKQNSKGTVFSQGKNSTELDDIASNTTASIYGGYSKKDIYDIPSDFPGDLEPAPLARAQRLAVNFDQVDRKKYKGLPAKIDTEIVELEVELDENLDYINTYAMRMPNGEWQVFEKLSQGSDQDEYGNGAKAYARAFMDVPKLSAAEKKQVASLQKQQKQIDRQIQVERSQNEQRVAAAKQTLFGDADEEATNVTGDSGRYAAAKGYDAVRLNDSYEPNNFMNLLNRSKILIQEDEVDWDTGVKTFGG